MIWEIIFWLFLIPLIIWGLHKLFRYSAIGIPFIRNNKKLYVSRPLNYLPKNKDFGSDIKIRIVLLKKK